MNVEKYTSASLVVGACVLTLTWLIFYMIKKNRNLPPGPWGLPIVGYYPFLSYTTHLHFSELAKKYGNVFSFRTVGGHLIIVLNGAKIIKEVLINRSAEFIGRPIVNNQVHWVTKGRVMDIQKLTPVTLAIGASVLTLTWLIFYMIKKNRNLPPGPWGLPLVGYYPFISSSTHLHFSELAKKYGNIFSFRTTGGNLVVVLNGIKLIKEVLVSRSAEFIGRPAPNNLIYWITKGHGVTPSEGETWRDQRRFFLQIAKNFGFGKMEIENRIQEEVRDLLKELRASKGTSIDAKYAVTCAVSPIISHILFNKKFKKEDSTFKGIAKALEQIVDIFVAKRFFLLGLAYDFALMFLPELKKAKQGRDFVQNATDKLVSEHVEAYDEQNRKDYVDEYIKHMDNLRKNGNLEKSTFSMEELRGNAMALFLEGTESISSAIWGWLLELSKHPHAQEVSQKELDNVVGRERLPSWMDRQNLPFFEAVLQETYRYASPFLVTTQYSNFEETSILGYRIPRRSTIVANLWSINSDPEIFPNPEKFDYERFVTREGKRIKREGPYPYGVGKRACVGESLAQMEVFIFIASILQSFKLEPGDREGTLKLLPRE